MGSVFWGKGIAERGSVSVCVCVHQEKKGGGGG